MLKKLVHNGILIPEPPKYHGITLVIRNENRNLTPKQEEMAYAWAKKQGTPYVDDLVFVKNFLIDFSAALGIRPVLKIDEIDFTPMLDIVNKERAAREAMSKEDKKLLAAKRKEIREELKEEYGYAETDQERIELASYMTEPSGIFMGRGKHPMRGRWKEGATQEDVTLNWGPEGAGEKPKGNWKSIIWQPESLWVAKWEDKLSGKLKYIWLHDTAPIKQAREAKKFDKALLLKSEIENVRTHIESGLKSNEFKIRKIATACFLIDALCLRVGDEKDPEEADTVGATTLRPEHIKFLDDGRVEFRFLGKDSVLWDKKIELPDYVKRNLEELSENARPSISDNGRVKHAAYNKPQLFPDVTSRNVNAYLGMAMKGLTAKVFRTFHATSVVKDTLEKSNVHIKDPEYRKWETVVNANMQAAILCNHTKQPPKNWSERKKKFREREIKAKERIKNVQGQIKTLKQELADLKVEFKEKKAAATKRDQKKKIKERYDKRITAKKNRLEKTIKMEEKAQQAAGKIKVQKAIASQNRTWNLGTSQKSYIDPRVFYDWGKSVDYDVLEKYYSTTLRRKFMWVKEQDKNETESA